MVQALHPCTPPSPHGNGRVERRPQDQLRLCAGVLLTTVPQALQEADKNFSACIYSVLS
jgi:hypothetical protein